MRDTTRAVSVRHIIISNNSNIVVTAAISNVTTANVMIAISDMGRAKDRDDHRINARIARRRSSRDSNRSRSGNNRHPDKRWAANKVRASRTAKAAVVGVGVGVDAVVAALKGVPSVSRVSKANRPETTDRRRN